MHNMTSVKIRTAAAVDDQGFFLEFYGLEPQGRLSSEGIPAIPCRQASMVMQTPFHVRISLWDLAFASNIYLGAMSGTSIWDVNTTQKSI